MGTHCLKQCWPEPPIKLFYKRILWVCIRGDTYLSVPAVCKFRMHRSYSQLWIAIWFKWPFGFTSYSLPFLGDETWFFLLIFNFLKYSFSYWIACVWNALAQASILLAKPYYKPHWIKGLLHIYLMTWGFELSIAALPESMLFQRSHWVNFCF